MRQKNKLAVLAFLIVPYFLFTILEIGCAPPDGQVGIEETVGFQLPPLNGNVPLSVVIPSSLSGGAENFRPYFDIFSWQSFIALSWPVSSSRGDPQDPENPNTFLQMTNTTPIVWTSYKNQFDLFGQGKFRPTPWEVQKDSISPCPDNQQVSHHFGTAKGNFDEQGEEAFSYPLVDQNLNYALFEMRYNEVQYNWIRGDDSVPSTWRYLKSNLVREEIANGGWVSMPYSVTDTINGVPHDTVGSLMVKASWKELAENDDSTKFYVVDQLIYDPVTNDCVKKKLGLVGIHIVQKLKNFRQWIWSSFEHVNNVPGPEASAPYNFNNGTNNPETSGGYANKPNSTQLIQNKEDRTAAQVTRYNAIPVTPVDTSTVDINAMYRELLENTVWANYELVITQWPTVDTATVLPGSTTVFYPEAAGSAFPVDGCTNTAAETFLQSPGDAAGAGGNSCMSCHYTSAATDFSWSLNLRSH